MAVDPLVPTDPSLGKAAGPPPPEKAAGADFLFHLIDIINPLQHIPVVSTIYRNITGDEIAPAARLVGGGLFAGPLGLIAAAANIVVDGVTGRDFGERAVALLGGKPNEPLLASIPEPLKPDPQVPPTDGTTPDEKSKIYAGPPPPLSAGFLATMLTEGNQPPARPRPPEPILQPGLADTILSALDKYQAMTRERNWPTVEAEDDSTSED